ncbi:hypothetical protein PR202_ga12290 [Eleusine coracana subsp. coracana]|uniref:Uncharacterized protein n=1 Tax=Eleusine coracana subsp. coracana TaxID=191504 RepID=A0AAV5CBD8_ELECO|nr:hypothetical protein PR202_ga12290 [Eleusine coracana subsp. coracana]
MRLLPSDESKTNFDEGWGGWVWRKFGEDSHGFDGISFGLDFGGARVWGGGGSERRAEDGEEEGGVVFIEFLFLVSGVIWLTPACLLGDGERKRRKRKASRRQSHARARRRRREAAVHGGLRLRPHRRRQHAGRGDTLGKRLLKLVYTKRSAVVVLRKWTEEGRTVQKYQLNRIVRELRKYTDDSSTPSRYATVAPLPLSHVCEWMRTQPEMRLLPGDHAVHLDLVAKVRGPRQRREVL